jgi:hypothetical protein
MATTSLTVLEGVISVAIARELEVCEWDWRFEEEGE